MLTFKNNCNVLNKLIAYTQLILIAHNTYNYDKQFFKEMIEQKTSFS